MFDLRKIFDLSKKFAIPDTLLKSKNCCTQGIAEGLELVSKELNHLAAILHVYAGILNFMK